MSMNTSMIKLPKIFSDGMVLGKTAKVWGWASPSQIVTASFLGKNYEATADETGRFTFTFTAEQFGGGHTLTIGDTVINDVHIGRVWFCGGQSNMEGPISRTRLSLGEYVVDDPRIRIFQAEKGLNFVEPEKDVNGKWNTATGDFLDNMYAVPYFFARSILESLPDDNAPIGLVCTPSGGTPMEGWLPEEIVSDFPDIHKTLKPLQEPNFVEKTTAEKDKPIQEWHKKLRENDKGLAENWQSPDYDDSNWQSRALLDPTGSPKHGVVWLRRKFVFPKVDGAVILNLGRFENSVTVYINGKEVINIGYSYPPCRCKIPAGLLREGENTIAVRIVGDGGNPIAIAGKEYALLHGSGRVNFLLGNWKWRVGAELEQCPSGVWFYGYPCGVYNFMLAPLLGYSVDGLLWYQGESNTGNPKPFKELFTAFVKHMRKHFGEDLPVIFTQLPNYIDPNNFVRAGGVGDPGENWAALRERQRQCLDIPNTAMAVTIDCGDYNDLHPTDKKTVGDRLALHARRLVYNENIVSDGPIVERVEFNKKEEKIIVHFKHKEGLWAKGGHPILRIEDHDDSIHNRHAAIINETLVADARGLRPSFVSFGWADCPSVVVYNAYCIPASPFEEEVK